MNSLTAYEYQFLREEYPDCEPQKPLPVKVTLPAGEEIILASKWYDIAVVDKKTTIKGKQLNASESRLHLVEVKEHCNSSNSFGAYTLGEWLLANIALKTDAFDYRILYVTYDGNKEAPESEPTMHFISLTEEFLENLLIYPQYKMYFHKDFVNKYFLQMEVGPLGRKNPPNELLGELFSGFSNQLLEAVKAME